MKHGMKWALVALAGWAAACRDQGPAAGPQVEMGEPDAVFPETFALVRTVREMPDGRVLVADPMGQVLVLADLATGTADTLGGVGPGPDEYMQPDAVWPLPGGRTLLVDLGNSRLTELGADLEFESSRSFVIGDLAAGGPLVLAVPHAVDGEGRLYLRGFDGNRSGVDSAYVLRVDFESGAIDSVAHVATQTMTRTTTGSANNQNTSIRPVPLSPADAWGVAEDGRVVVAYATDYHVEWILPGDSTVAGPPVAYDPLPIGPGEKEEWQSAQGGSMSISMSASDVGMSLQVSRGSAGDSDDDLDALPWPEALPPFYAGEFNPVRIDPAGRAWVRVHTGASAPTAYDLFGASGEREARIRLLPGRRVVAFGSGVVYVVHADELGMESLERYALPGDEGDGG